SSRFLDADYAQQNLAFSPAKVNSSASPSKPSSRQGGSRGEFFNSTNPLAIEEEKKEGDLSPSRPTTSGALLLTDGSTVALPDPSFSSSPLEQLVVPLRDVN